jgi:hypothetical protein
MGDKEATLNYIDKLHSSLQTVGETLHSYIKWNFLICLILIFLSTGELKLNNKISVTGIEFEFSLIFLITVLSSIITWLLIQISGLHIKKEKLEIQLFDYISLFLLVTQV